MGFKTYSIEHVNPCWVKDGIIYVRLYSGFVCSYKSGIPYDIEEQVNTFRSSRVAFVLYHEDDMLVGRNDGTISIYKKGTNLLTGLNYFEYPLVYLQHVGFTTGSSWSRMSPVYIDGRDQKTVYCGHFVALADGIPQHLNMELAMACCKSKEKVLNSCYVYKDGGELVEFSDWHLSTRRRSADNGIDF